MSELNPNLREYLDALRDKATRQRVDLWQVLLEAGLLFTEDLRRNHRAHALQQALDALEKRTVPQLIGPAYAEGRSTPKDMRRGITAFLEERVKLARAGQA